MIILTNIMKTINFQSEGVASVKGSMGTERVNGGCKRYLWSSWVSQRGIRGLLDKERIQGFG